jgi:hypothetical protein
MRRALVVLTALTLAGGALACGRTVLPVCDELSCVQGAAAPIADAGTRDAAIAHVDASFGAEDAAALDSGLPSFDDGGLAAMCPDGKNGLFVYGDPGDGENLEPLYLDSNAGSWLAMPAGDWYLEVEVWPNDLSHGDGWNIAFATQEMRVPLAVQRYDHVRMIPGDNLHAGMYVSGGWQACAAISGWFEIEELVREPDPRAPETPKLRSLTATFEQRCDERPSMLRGCLHYEAPN